MGIDDVGQLMVLLVGVSTLLCNAPIVVIQLAEFVRQLRRGDGLQPYRLVIVSILLQATIILTWRMLIWADVTFADQVWLGPTANRWRLDLVIGLACQLLALYVAVIFWRDRWRSRRARHARSSA